MLAASWERSEGWERGGALVTAGDGWGGSKREAGAVCRVRRTGANGNRVGSDVERGGGEKGRRKEGGAANRDLGRASGGGAVKLLKGVLSLRGGWKVGAVVGG